MLLEPRSFGMWYVRGKDLELIEYADADNTGYKVDKEVLLVHATSLYGS